MRAKPTVTRTLINIHSVFVEKFSRLFFDLHL